MFFEKRLRFWFCLSVRVLRWFQHVRLYIGCHLVWWRNWRPTWGLNSRLLSYSSSARSVSLDWFVCLYIKEIKLRRFWFKGSVWLVEYFLFEKGEDVLEFNEAQGECRKIITLVPTYDESSGDTGFIKFKVDDEVKHTVYVHDVPTEKDMNRSTSSSGSSYMIITGSSKRLSIGSNNSMFQSSCVDVEEGEDIHTCYSLMTECKENLLLSSQFLSSYETSLNDWV